MPKIEFIGDLETSQKSGKTFRKCRIGGQDLAAFNFAEKNLMKFKVGDEVNFEASGDGKYLNKIFRGGSAPSGGGPSVGAVPPGASQPHADPAEGLVAGVCALVGSGTPIEEAIDKAIKIRSDIRKALEVKGNEDEAAIKEKTVMSRVEKIDAKLKDNHAFMLFVSKQLSNTDKFNRLVGDLDAVLKKEKILQMTPDGIPAFIYA